MSLGWQEQDKAPCGEGDCRQSGNGSSTLNCVRVAISRFRRWPTWLRASLVLLAGLGIWLMPGPTQRGSIQHAVAHPDERVRSVLDTVGMTFVGAEWKQIAYPEENGGWEQYITPDRENDFRLSAHAKGPKAKRWREAASKMTPDEFARMLIPDVVDTVIFELLQAMDQGVLPLSFTGTSGTTIDLAKDEDGLAGRYFCRDGWCGQYAQERYAEDYTESCEDFIRELLSKFNK